MTRCKSCQGFSPQTPEYGYCKENDDTVFSHQIDNENNCPEWKLNVELAEKLGMVRKLFELLHYLYYYHYPY